MDSFDLGRLTDFDFEVVCRDLFSRLLDLDLEIFAQGPDAGIDLRHMSPTSGRTIIQCKHWIRSSSSKLLSHMKKLELPKIRNLGPARYILATSVDLSKAAKDEFYRALQPYVRSTGDIYGLSEISAALNLHEDIVRRHLRLWLSSTSILQSILQKKSLMRSATLLEEIDDRLKLYAPNVSLTRASKILAERNVCIIVGTPGIGKTTLAQVLAASYLERGFELVEISADADDINATWDENKPQFFYYDDFLGQTALGDKFGKNEDNRLLSLIAKIERTPNKRLILTTREYLLAQAKQQYARLSTPAFDVSSCVIDLSDYTRTIRAEILYNHVYYSAIPHEVKNLFGQKHAYNRIINHRNFNPRLIADSLKLFSRGREVPIDPVQYVLGNLADPRQIWQHIADHELNDSDIQVLYTFFTFSDFIDIVKLEESWASCRSQFQLPVDSRTFKRSIKTLEGTMLRTNLTANSNKILVNAHNPSVRDFLLHYVPAQRGVIAQLIRSFSHFNQLEHLWTLASPSYYTANNSHPGQERLFVELQKAADSVSDYIIRAFDESENEDGEVFTGEWLPYCLSALKIGDKLGLDSVLEFIFAEILDDLPAVLSDPDDAIALVNNIASMQHDIATSHLKEIADAVSNYVASSTYSFLTARSALEKLESIVDHVPDEILASVHSELGQHIDEILSQWESDQPSSANWHELDELVSYIESNGIDVSYPEGYDRAYTALKKHRVMNKDTSSPKIAELKTKETDDTVIERMMQLLLDED